MKTAVTRHAARAARAAVRPATMLATIAAAALLAACGGGGDDGTTAAAAPGTSGGSGAAAPLVISAATPATLNGTLDKSAAQFESNSGSDTGGAPYDATAPYCRVAAYGLVGADGVKYFLQIPFRKDNRAVGLLVFGNDATFATLVRVDKPTTGVAIDVANRRITFTNFVMTPGTVSITLNGTLEYITNVAPENRAACG